jgi:hypothetical protein
MRVRLCAAVGAVAAILAMLACSPTDSRHEPTACVSAPAAVTAQPAQADALRIADSGFTQLGRNNIVVSLGAVLENTSDQVAYRTRVAFKVTGADGRSVVPALSGELLIQEIPMILPKQKMPLGAWTYVEGQVTAFTVEVGPTTWVASDATFAQITTTVQSLSRTHSDSETASVTYQMTLPYCHSLAMRGTAIVFRNASGEIVGGSFELGALTCPSGVSTQSPAALRSAPIDIDENKTEVYPYCDFKAAGTPKSSSGPVN